MKYTLVLTFVYTDVVEAKNKQEAWELFNDTAPVDMEEVSRVEFIIDEEGFLSKER